MPPPQVIPEQLRARIERRIMTEKQPHSQVLEWLANEGYSCSTQTLKRQCRKWGISRRGLAADPLVVGYIDGQFHTTLDNDAAIATQLNTRGYPITTSDVKEIRLGNGWRHHQPTAEQQQEQWEETYTLHSWAGAR
jgi:hypothetical protein